MKNRWFRTLVGGLSFTTALFVFQACYGTPQDFGMDVLIEGKVRSKTTGQAIGGIKISLKNGPQYEYSNEEGEFSLYTSETDSYTLFFEDVDSTLNRSFANRDTLLTSVNKQVYLDIALDDL